MCSNPLVIKNPNLIHPDRRELGRKIKIIDAAGETDYRMKRLARFNQSFYEGMISVPCGKCLDCLRSFQNGWFLRMDIERRKYDPENISFVTLTYNNLFLPSKSVELLDESTGEVESIELNTLSVDDVQKFWKRFRNHLDDYNASHGTSYSFTYFGCGEYGYHFQRPHYHFILFGIPPFLAELLCDECWRVYSDKMYDEESCTIVDSPTYKADSPLYDPKGYRARIGRCYVDKKSAGNGSLNYVSKYCSKSLDVFSHVDDDLHCEVANGKFKQVYDDIRMTEVYENFCVPSFRLMSKGIGSIFKDKQKNIHEFFLDEYAGYHVLHFDPLTMRDVIAPVKHFVGKDKQGRDITFKYYLPRYLKYQLYSGDQLRDYSANLRDRQIIQFNLSLDNLSRSMYGKAYSSFKTEGLDVVHRAAVLRQYSLSLYAKRQNSQRTSLFSFLENVAKTKY